MASIKLSDEASDPFDNIEELEYGPEFISRRRSTDQQELSELFDDPLFGAGDDEEEDEL